MTLPTDNPVRVQVLTSHPRPAGAPREAYPVPAESVGLLARSEDRRGEGREVPGRHPGRPLGPGEHTPEHEDVHVGQARPQEVKHQDGGLLLLGAVGRDFSALAEEYERPANPAYPEVGG